MAKISCCIRLGEVPLHLYQITSGFLLLNKYGIINLKVERLKRQDENILPYNMMEVIINDEFRIIYDVNDGYDNLLFNSSDYIEFMNEMLGNVDFYFKRSFSEKYNKKLKYRHKIYPLGLNYMVTVPGNVAHFPTFIDSSKEKLKKLVRMLPLSQYYNGLYNIDSFEDIPTRDREPRILFMARLWDTAGDSNIGISPLKKEERTYINDLRVSCIRQCQKEFGEKFFGGISPSKFAIENFPDIVIQDKGITKRNNYIKQVKESSICIATMGLHESVGWKFAEYIAASKAIVTEELHYELPGDFKNEKNFLLFKTPEQCIEQIYKLVNSEELRYQMMVNNFNYYHQYVRPDRLVLNSLLTVLNNGGIKLETDFNSIYTYI
ncbi:glycosyltransferase family 1 protein [Neobacillus vireti]|uniref:glycosyltransferase family 1 protein n=1 Tax=Neobacillus vireti TaxID=220686 RepID=UPI002FFFA299